MDTTRDLDTWREEAVTSWKDHRIVDDKWLDIHIWFHKHMYADLVNSSLELSGFSFRDKGDTWLLVLKLHREDIPLVAFVNGSTPTSCMRKTRILLRDGGLNLVQDKYG